MSARRTYLDHNASAPLRPEARAAMVACLDEYGNPSSIHAEGRRARAVVDAAREEIAALVGARPSEIVFTSGASEANAWALSAGWQSLFVGAAEHASVLAPAAAHDGVLTELPAGGDGVIGLDALTAGLSLPHDPARTLVSLQFANGETGAIQPVAAAVEIARAQGAVVHTDAVQAAGRIPLSFSALGCDLMSLSAHKLGGPKGVGALIIRDGLELAPLIRGGGQERRRRGGTEAVALIAGFGAAARCARQNLSDWARIDGLRASLEDGVHRLTPDAVVLAADAPRLPNTVCLARPGEQAATLVIRLDLAGIAVSAGAACSSGKIGPSHVLAAMNAPHALAQAAIRISLGWSSTAEDVDDFLAAWARLFARAPAPSHEPPAPLRAGAPMHAGDY